MDLPTLDLSLFTGGNASQRMQLASDLLNSLSRHGFVKLVNHGISDLVVAQLFEWVCIGISILVDCHMKLTAEPLGIAEQIVLPDEDRRETSDCTPPRS